MCSKTCIKTSTTRSKHAGRKKRKRTYNAYCTHKTQWILEEIFTQTRHIQAMEARRINRMEKTFK